ncbi:MAG: quinone-dependent dihydroorotate dehydrogenase [Xanthomonadales bacterium]|nr:quinone-dependent dihydroorotate dehydrogenase [Xanthomonadales bacterium]
MSLYRLLRKGFFSVPPETAHDMALESLKLGNGLGFRSWMFRDPAADPCTVMGLDFPNRVGIAAGLDKNGDYIDALGGLGLGFLEIGTVTPKPQSGNPRPRLFRLPKSQAIINRMGFNNKGVDHLVRQVEKRRWKGILGINIGKNKDTPNAQAADDYLICLEKVYAHADYIVINISSPNTPGLRDLQGVEDLDKLLSRLNQRRTQLTEEHGFHVPFAVKVAPDLSEGKIQPMADCIAANEIEAVITTNTTIDRQVVCGQQYAEEAGGLSGAPLLHLSNQTLKAFRKALPADINLIGTGGIMSGIDALSKRQLGADLVQIYTGFIYQGPGLIADIAKEISGSRAVLLHK